MKRLALGLWLSLWSWPLWAQAELPAEPTEPPPSWQLQPSSGADLLGQLARTLAALLVVLALVVLLGRFLRGKKSFLGYSLQGGRLRLLDRLPLGSGHTLYLVALDNDTELLVATGGKRARRGLSRALANAAPSRRPFTPPEGEHTHAENVSPPIAES